MSNTHKQLGVGDAQIYSQKWTCTATEKYIYTFDTHLHGSRDGKEDVSSKILRLFDKFSLELVTGWSGDGVMGRMDPLDPLLAHPIPIPLFSPSPKRSKEIDHILYPTLVYLFPLCRSLSSSTVRIALHWLWSAFLKLDPPFSPWSIEKPPQTNVKNKKRRVSLGMETG